MTTNGKAAEHALLQKLASFTKIPKSEFVKTSLMSKTDEVLPVYSYPVLDEKIRSKSAPLFYSVTLGGRGVLNLQQLLVPKQWMKCPLREAYLQGIGFVDPKTRGEFVLTTQLVGMVWATTCHYYGSLPVEEREFTGGILVQDPETKDMFVTRPVHQYLVELLGQKEEEE